MKKIIEVQYSNKNTPFVWASDLYKSFAIKEPFFDWFNHIKGKGNTFIENEDYFFYKKHNDWAVQVEMAKHIAIMQDSARGKAIRMYLLDLNDKVQEGKMLDTKQMSVLFELCDILGFFSVQEYLESEHFTIFEQKNENWWRYRARVFGQSAKDLKDMMRALGKKYENQRQVLFHIDRYELIRRATFDLFKAMGKSDIYATNVAKFAKDIAIKIKPNIYDDRNSSISFKTNEQEKKIEKMKEVGVKNLLIDKF